MWSARSQEGEVEGCSGDSKEVDNRYEGHCQGGAGGRTWGGGGGGLEGGCTGKVDQE